jgi:hypothetical protein
VIAVANGVAQPGTNGLGGNVVWLRGASQPRTFYYAHLDRWAIAGVTTVAAGDVLGYVGNTGNAQSTAPHLHFGIYERGAIDPAPFLRPDDGEPPPPTGHESYLGERVRVQTARTAFRDGASGTARVQSTIPRDTVARVFGLSGAHLRVSLPDRSAGYLADNAVRPASTPLRTARLGDERVLREAASDVAPVVGIAPAGSDVAVLGRFGGYELLRGPGGMTGWAAAAPARPGWQAPRR